MNLNHLLLFDAVAEAGSVTAAAERLLVSQPAVSKQLKEFQRSLGGALVERTPKGVRLTAAGEALATYAKRVRLLSEEAAATIGDLDALRRGRLRIGATAPLGTYLLPPALVRYRRKYPGVDLKLSLDTPRNLERQIADGELDLVASESPPGAADVNVVELGRDQLVPIVPRADA